MSVAEILNGESVNVEYKARVPEKSLNYMKTVVAFANGFGGRLVFGVADGTREIVGVDEADVFKMMDAIANAISDSCEPAIVPDIMLQTIAGKTVIVVDVLPGGQRPYFIKSLGLNGGVYIRVAGTTRPADRYMVRELLFEGSNRSFDQAICSELTVSEDDIDALCRAMQEEARRNARSDQKCWARAALELGDFGRKRWCGISDKCLCDSHRERSGATGDDPMRRVQGKNACGFCGPAGIWRPDLGAD